MINMELVIKRIKEVENKDDFDDLKEKFKMSNADLDNRIEAIRLLALEFPHYCDIDKRNSEILKSIKDGEAELPSLD